MLGPICDSIGVEQGECYSDKLYKLTNNEHITVVQESGLGAELGFFLAKDGSLCLSRVG